MLCNSWTFPFLQNAAILDALQMQTANSEYSFSLYQTLFHLSLAWDFKCGIDPSYLTSRAMQACKLSKIRVDTQHTHSCSRPMSILGMHTLSCMYTGRKSAKTGRLSDQPIVFGSSGFQPICKSGDKSAEIKFSSDQRTAENRLKQPIRTVHKF